MKLQIPAQNAPTAASSASDPRKLKKVLSGLPNANMGEFTKQTFNILRDQNRQTMPVSNRLENMEMLRVYSRQILDGLKKYFINRTLPLPEKSQKIVQLNQSVLQELIYGYEIIACDKKADDKTLTRSICRAIKYLSEMFLRASEVYEPCPENLWHDAHRMYALAESKNLIDIPVADSENDSRTTIADSYKQLLLLALARPTTLRQSDNARVYNQLVEWSQYADIQQEANEDMINRVFCIHLSEDSVPDYLNIKDLSDNKALRILDTSRLVSHVEQQITDKKQQKQKLAIGNAMTLETLTSLARAWGENAERRFSRIERQGHINVAIGLSKICRAMHESKKIQHAPPDPDIRFFQTTSKLERTLMGSSHEFFQDPVAPGEEQKLTLQSIADDKRRQGYITTGNVEKEDRWDMVAKGRVLTDTYEKARSLIDKEELQALHRKNTDLYWEIVNMSPGGYCLRWNSDQTSTAQIGELIALQEFDDHNDFCWHVGVIRWMQYTPANGLEIGVQVLSPKVEAATAQRARRLDEVPFDCLMLPAIKALNQTASAILPAHAFDTNNKLVIKISEDIFSVVLGTALEHTGSFTQFNYDVTELDKRIEDQLTKEKTVKRRDDFDELWLSL